MSSLQGQASRIRIQRIFGYVTCCRARRQVRVFLRRSATGWVAGVGVS